MPQRERKWRGLNRNRKSVCQVSSFHSSLIMRRKLFFTGQCQKYDAPAKDWTTRQIIPGKTTTRWRWQVYDVSDINNPSELAIWERGYKESEQIVYYLSQKKQELTIMRNGRPNSTDTTYNIYPAK